MKPAIDGTLNVLNACLNTSVERVVVTSSGLTIFGAEFNDKTYSEADWADFNKLKTHYSRSKYLAEKACWDFYSKNVNSLDIAVVHPVLILGPVLNSSSGTSVTRFSNLFGNKIEKIPNINFPVCDVRGKKFKFMFICLIFKSLYKNFSTNSKMLQLLISSNKII